MKWWFPENISTYGSSVDHIFYIILGVTGVIFVGVFGVLIFFAVKYRHRENIQVKYTHGNNLIELIWTLIPAMILIFLLVQSEKIWSEIKKQKPNPGLEIEIEAQQFAWNIRYPATGVETLNQLHIPVDKTIRIQLTSKDVIHSFFVPVLRVKQDAIPGTKIDIWFKATKTGAYEFLCAEFCGLAHYRMKGYLTVSKNEDFEAWQKAEIKEQSTLAEEEEEEDEW